MPSEGNYGTIMGLPEKKAAIVSAGINLFELRKAHMSFSPVRDFGFWDVRVREEVHQIRQTLFYRQNWFKGQTAYIEYFPNKRGFLFAHCPDDPIWHNRVMLSGILGKSGTIIERYHTQNGVISGKRMTAEIQLIDEYLREWQIVSARKVIFSSKSYTAAEEAATDMVAKGKLADYSIERRMIVPVQNLIRAYRGNWMESEKFQKEHRPAMQELIRARLGGGKPDVATVGSQLVSALRQMSEQDRAALKQLLLQDIPGPAHESQEGKALEDLDWHTLRRVGADLGIKAQGIKKDELVAEIRRVQAEKQEAATGPAAPSEAQGYGNPYEGMDSGEEEEIR